MFCTSYLTGCGPERSVSEDEQLIAETEQIAQEYDHNRNLNQARTQLSALNVANSNQWLVYVTETRLSENSNPTLMTALVRLANDMGLQSVSIQRYAAENGLIERVVAQESQATTNQSQPLIQPQSEQIVASANNPAQNAEQNDVSQTTDNASPPDEQPTETPLPQPAIQANNIMNVRGGPGLAYNVVGALQAAESANLVGKNPAGDWWQILLPNGTEGWVYGPLVTTSGDVSRIAIASNIPTPPPTLPPPPPTATPVPEEPTPEPAPVVSGPDFQLIEKRLWGVEENGGRLAGNSVNCGDKRELHVHVLDANGNPINGVHVLGIYTNVTVVTGSQGKGDGVAEYVLGGGEDIRIIKDVDGRDVSSDLAAGMSTRPDAISFPDLKQARYCTDDASCRKFVDTFGCGGHFSWTVKFRRNR